MQASRWRTFSGVVFTLVGAFNVIGGLGALFREEVFVAGNEVLVSDVDSWGWFLLVLGLIQVAVAAGIFTGRGWGRVLGVLLAAISGMLHIAFLVAFPAFSVISITLAIVVIYGLIVQDDQRP
jgi:hypothetical protein